MSSLITVIIPAYNSARFLPDALESVFHQTCGNFEVIVVDDGSTDNTREVLKPYMDRIVYLHKRNEGTVASARNMGLKHANGDFVAFLDADDTWLPGKTEIQMAQMADESVAMTGSSAKESGGGGRPVVAVSYEQMLLKNLFSASSVVCRRACIAVAGLFDERPEFHGVEDWELWLRIIRRSKAVYIPEKIVINRLVEGSVSSLANSEAMFRGELAVLSKQMLETDGVRPGFWIMRRARSNRYMSAAQDEKAKDHRLRSFSLILMACMLYPPQMFRREAVALVARAVVGGASRQS
ncbi:MAG: glycosyltransferase family A protein [bacterium]